MLKRIKYFCIFICNLYFVDKLCQAYMGKMYFPDLRTELFNNFRIMNTFILIP